MLWRAHALAMVDICLAIVKFEFRQIPLALEIVRKAGADAEALLARCGLPANAATEPSVASTVDEIEAFLSEAARVTQIPAFGLELARHVPRGRFGWLEFGMRSAATLDDAINLLVRFGSLINRKAGFSYAVTDRARVLNYEVVARTGGLGPQLNEFTIGYVLKIAREGVGQEWIPERVWFAHAEQPWARTLATHFACPISYRASSSGLAIPLAAATSRFSGYDPALQTLLRARLDELMPMADSTQAITARARAELVKRIGRDDVGAGSIARALGMSTRTLQRSLATEGSTYAKLVEDARRTLSQTLLARNDLSVEQVAALLGYADLRGFDRAFKRWTGVTPTRWRSRHADG